MQFEIKREGDHYALFIDGKFDNNYETPMQAATAIERIILIDTAYHSEGEIQNGSNF